MTDYKGHQPTNDLLDLNRIIIVYDELGNKKIQNLVGDIVSAGTLHVSGNAMFNGNVDFSKGFSSDITLNAGTTLNLSDGSSIKPSINFGTGATKLYTNGTNLTIENGVQSTLINSNGLTTQAIYSNTISTTSGDLSLAPIGANINFNNKNLLNVGSIIVNPYAYKIIAPNTVTTSSPGFSTLFVINTSAQQALYAEVKLIAANINNSKSGTITVSVKIQNIGGVVTYVAFNKISSLDTGLTSATNDFQVSGSNVNVRVNAGTGNTVNWFGTADVIVQDF